MVKLAATNPLTGKSMNLASPLTWVYAILFVVFVLIIIGAGKWLLDKGKGITGIGQPTGTANPDATLLGRFF